MAFLKLVRQLGPLWAIYLWHSIGYSYSHYLILTHTHTLTHTLTHTDTHTQTHCRRPRTNWLPRRRVRNLAYNFHTMRRHASNAHLPFVPRPLQFFCILAVFFLFFASRFALFLCSSCKCCKRKNLHTNCSSYWGSPCLLSAGNHAPCALSGPTRSQLAFWQLHDAGQFKCKYVGMPHLSIKFCAHEMQLLWIAQQRRGERGRGTATPIAVINEHVCASVCVCVAGRANNCKDQTAPLHTLSLSLLLPPLTLSFHIPHSTSCTLYLPPSHADCLLALKIYFNYRELVKKNNLPPYTD